MPRSLRARIALAALIVWVMLPNLVWLWMGSGAVVWISALIVPGILLLVLFAILGSRLWLCCLLLSPFAVLAPVEAFYVGAYGHPSTAQILATVVATNLREVWEYLGATLFLIALSMLAGLALAVVATWWCARSGLCWHQRSRTWVLAGAMTFSIVVFAIGAITTSGSLAVRARAGVGTLHGLTDPIEASFPFGVFTRIAEYRREWHAMRASAARLETFRFRAQRIDSVHQRQVYVLVIGESSRRDHWQLFGYPRVTNPELTKIPNLVPIPDLTSSWPASVMAIPMLLTRKPPTDRDLIWKEASILRAMQEAGFDTYWISNQMSIGVFDSPVSTYALEAMHVEFLNHVSWKSPGSYDGDLLQPLRDALHDSGNDLFIVLHMMGSHGNYDFRYPESYKRFQPTLFDDDASTSKFELRRNSYDNTILYTDHVLAQIIDTLRTTQVVAALWYESDHGEDLPTPTCTLDGHGNGTSHDFEIPALFWYSDAYAANFPQQLAALRMNADKRVMSANTFESLIDMAGLDFASHDRSMSLFSAQWRYRPRLVTGIASIDIDKADRSKRCDLLLPPQG